MPAGLPHLALPGVAASDLLAMLPAAASMMVVILAQSAATSRAYGELIDVAGMRRIYALRREEFVVAVLTTIAVVILGVEQGVLVAIVASIVDHLRHSYQPRNSVAG